MKKPLTNDDLLQFLKEAFYALQDQYDALLLENCDPDDELKKEMNQAEQAHREIARLITRQL